MCLSSVEKNNPYAVFPVKQLSKLIASYKNIVEYGCPGIIWRCWVYTGKFQEEMKCGKTSKFL